MIPTTTVTWYVARTHDGQFSRGLNWTQHFDRARLLRKIGPVRAAITHYVKANPGAPVPQILSWSMAVDAATIIDDTADTRKRAFKREMAEIARQQESIKWDLEDLAQEEKRLVDKRARLEGRA